jgi:Ni/Fe-hydrogenase subunit HybB-like protein
MSGPVFPVLRHSAAPLGGKILTPFFKFLMFIALIAVVALAVRFLQGLGAATAMSDGYGFGLWIAFDVVVGTAVGCGGYSMAMLVYVANKGQYHPLVRPAMLTGALGYTFAGASIFIDIGRYWSIWKIPVFVPSWNGSSALLEVALCVMTYIIVLWFEFSPVVLEGWRNGRNAFLRGVAESWGPRLDKAMPWIIALGLLLPTMHQSSLGTVMLLPASKVHGLWLTSFLPLLFLVNAVFLGYGAVIAEATISAFGFKRPRETALLASMGPWIAALLLLFTGLRIVDLLVRGKFGLAFLPTRFALFFWLETVLAVAPALLLLGARARASTAGLFRAGLLILAAGILYRFDTYLVAYDPGPAWTYFPSLGEMAISLGLVAGEIMIYVYAVKKFPVLSAAPAAASR